MVLLADSPIMSSRTLPTLLLVGAWAVLRADADDISRPWNRDVIYFALLDRFFDGDPANDVPAGSDATLYDASQKEIGKYHGGDFRGIELALAAWI